jgi:hypothetical protein
MFTISLRKRQKAKSQLNKVGFLFVPLLKRRDVSGILIVTVEQLICNQ